MSASSHLNVRVHYVWRLRSFNFECNVLLLYTCVQFCHCKMSISSETLSEDLRTLKTTVTIHWKFFTKSYLGILISLLWYGSAHSANSPDSHGHTHKFFLLFTSTAKAFGLIKLVLNNIKALNLMCKVLRRRFDCTHMTRIFAQCY